MVDHPRETLIETTRRWDSPAPTERIVHAQADRRDSVSIVKSTMCITFENFIPSMGKCFLFGKGFSLPGGGLKSLK